MNADLLKVTFGLIVITFALSYPEYTYAVTLDDKVTQVYFDDILKECNTQLNEWKKLWKIEVGLAFLVLVLGAVSAAIQNFNFQSVKAITVISGLVITVTTGFINLVGWDDYRSLNKSISKVNSITRNMERAKREYGLFKAGDKQVPVDQFGALYKEFKKVQEPQPDQIVKYEDFGYGIIKAAYAEPPVWIITVPPVWISTVPEDTRNLYFVGVGDGTKLEDAKAKAKDNSIKNAKVFLSNMLRSGNEFDDIKSNSLASSLINTAEEVESYIKYDNGTNNYRYYSLIGINKSLAEAEVKLFAVQHGVNAPATINVLASARRDQNDYTSQLNQTEELLNQAYDNPP